MSAGPSLTFDGEDEAAREIAPLKQLDFARAVVAGEYIRFDEAARNTLKDFRTKVAGALAGATRQPSNFVIWGAPGSGKSFLVQQVAAAAGAAAALVELNIAQLDSDRFSLRLEEVAQGDHDVICLVDEVDAHPGEAWPYE